ncbi:hypothetical protein, partial [Rhizobium sp.]|uniref:hypothetical protein n=1 Tax=Rhizobium sp. TaxID=391 RepID=UPI002AA92A86
NKTRHALGNEYVLNLRGFCDHGFGFGDLLASYADCARLELHKWYRWQRVDLDMGPDIEAVMTGIILESLDVSLDYVEIDECCEGRQVFPCALWFVHISLVLGPR